MMNPIDTLFQRLRAANRKAFIPFLPAGDPDMALTRDAIVAVAGAGASLIEVGFPFSDPIADGPVIQESYTRALSKNLKLADIFSTLKTITTTPGWQTPLVAMSSYSIIWKKGPEQFIADAQAAGLSGAVVPDLPVEEAEELAKRCRDHGFALILLVTPTTSPERAAKIVAACSGFVYVVSIVGITGDKSGVPGQIQEMMTRLRTMTDKPLCVGFGVSRPDHVRELRDIADGVIVGTALVRKLCGANTPEGRVQAVSEIRGLVSDLSMALNDGLS